MAGISIGRFGLSPTAGEVHVTAAQLNGDQLTISGDLIRTTDTDALSVIKMRAIQQQIDGMAAGGEWAVPLVWSETPHLDGWWRVNQAQHSSGHPVIQGDTLDWQFDLTRVAGWRLPWLEHRAQLVLLPNDHGFVPVTDFSGPAFGAPETYSRDFEVSPYPTVFGPTVGFCRAAAGVPGSGAFTMWRLEWASAAEVVRRVDFRMSAAAAAAYNAACVVEGYYGTAIPSAQTGAEVEWYPLVGRQAPVPSLRVSNGLMTVRPMPDTGAIAGGVQIEWHDFVGSLGSVIMKFGSAGATSWQSARALGFGPDIKACYVLRNTPELCTIRAVYMVETRGAVNVDFTLRRGGRTVSIVMSELAGATRQWMLEPSTAIAMTATSAGMMQQTTAVSNSKLVIMSPAASNRTLGTGQCYHTSATAQGRFGIGMQVNNGTSAGDTWSQAVTAMVNHYYSQPGLRMISAGR